MLLYPLFLMEKFGSVPGIQNICNVFFIVLDLRLTKVGLGGAPFLYPYEFVGTFNNRCHTMISGDCEEKK